MSDWLLVSEVGSMGKALLDPGNSPPVSAAADGDDDFKLITGSQWRTGMLAFRYDLAVFLDSDALARVAKLIDQAGDGQRFRKLAIFAIDLEGKHRAILAEANAR
jgi:hypothetical protein